MESYFREHMAERDLLFHDTRYFDIMMQATKTSISPYGMSMVVLAIHVLITFMAAVWLVGRIRTHGGE